jgi:predicted ATPase
MEPLWHITLLGELSLGRSDSLTDSVRRFRSQKVASLLAFLAFHVGRGISRDALCALLWPDDDPEIARNRLRVTLSSLRKQLEPPDVPFGAVLETHGHGDVRLRGDVVATDVQRFERAVRAGEIALALALYRGELLPGVYDDWVFPERERLEGLFRKLDVLAAQRPATAGGGEPAPAPAAPVSDRLPPPRLPLYLTRFFGRDAVRAQLRTLLDDPTVRLVTLTGPGGNGKTRLATELARELSAVRPVFFAPLADLWESSRLVVVVREAIDPSGDRSGDSLERIVAALNHVHRPLLVLDNLEQLVPGCVPAIEQLLRRVPELTLLATSRRRLDLPGEREVALPPLASPPDTPLDIPTLAAVPSVALFVDRAQAIRPDFTITERSAPEIAALCRLLDGIPLATELAAARVATLTLTQMRTMLFERWDALGAAPGKRSGKEDRHRSLRAAIEWSYGLLSPDLRQLFARLCVFRGGCDIEAAEGVCELSGTMEALSRLRASSLLTIEERAGKIRFRMLATLQAFAREQLDDAAFAQLRQRHAHHYLQVAERALLALDHPGTHPFEALEADHDNLRTALKTLQDDPEGGIDGLKLAAALRVFWWSCGHLVEGLERALAALAHPGAQGPLPDRATLLNGAGVLADMQGDLERAWMLQQESLAIERAIERPAGVARALNAIGIIARKRGALHLAQAQLEEALAIMRSLDHRHGIASVLGNVGRIAEERGDLPGAIAVYQESLALQRTLGDSQGIAVALHNLATLLARQGDRVAARTALNEVLQLGADLQDKRTVLHALDSLSEIAGQQGYSAWAVRGFGAVETLRRALRYPLTEPEQRERDRAMTALQAAVGAERFHNLFAAGEALPLDEAIAFGFTPFAALEQKRA